jgi:SAM-dependent methyltransferase
MTASSQIESRYQDGRYLEDNPTWHEEDALTKATWVNGILNRHPDIRVASICDVGCGTGGVLVALRSLMGTAVRAVGFEPSAVAARIAKETHADVEVIPRPPTLADGPFDVAVILDVFEHVEDFYGFLTELRGLADHYVFHIPLDMTALNIVRVDELMRIRDTLGHIHHFCPQSARDSLRVCGYEIVDEHFTIVAGGLTDGLPLSVKLLRILRRTGFRVAPDLTARMIGGLSLMVLARSADAGVVGS